MSPKFLHQQRWTIPYKAKSLVWHGDHLVDWAAGGTRLSLMGEVEPGGLILDVAFDNAVCSPSGEFAAVYQTLGDEGLLLHKGAPLRGLTRDDYHKETYEYPITFLTLPDGTEALAHCPDSYCELEIEDALTGERLKTDAEARDIFFSRLKTNKTSTWLSHSSWIWQPWDYTGVYKVEDVVQSPNIIRDTTQCDLTLGIEYIEMADVTFLEETVLAISHSEDGSYNDAYSQISVMDLETQTVLSTVDVDAFVGTMHTVDHRHFMSFFKNPTLIDAFTGEVLYRWEDLDSGIQCSSIIHHIPMPPSIAWHPTLPMFAIAQAEEVVIIYLDLNRSGTYSLEQTDHDT